MRLTTAAAALPSVSWMITTLPRPTVLAAALTIALVGSVATPAMAVDHDVATEIAAVVDAARSDPSASR